MPKRGMITLNNKKVLIGMSGGVDSSVSALLLKQNGYDVTGVTLELFENSKNTYEDAKKICDFLKIPHYIYNCKEDFKKNIIDDFINCYSNSLTRKFDS